MKFKDMKKGMSNLHYSLKATMFREFGFPFVPPKNILMGVTNKCNARCKMCSIWKIYLEAPENLSKEMTLEEFKIFIDKNDYLKDIALTGGEPLLKKELYDMILYLDKKGYATGNITNSILPEYIMATEEKIIKQISDGQTHGLTVSVDGLREEHDRVRGTPGLFDKALKIVKWGLEMEKKYPSFGIGVSHTITAHNYKDLLKFIDFFVDLGLKPGQISFRTAQVSGNYYKNTDSEEIPTEVDGIVKELKRVMEKYPVFGEDWFYKNMPNYVKDPDNYRDLPCYAGTSFAFIGNDWEVQPCIYLESIGNLRDYNFDMKQLWKSKKAVEARKQIKAKKCPNCWTGCTTIPSRASNIKMLAKHYVDVIKKEF